MAYSETTALRKLARMSKKIRILQGGTSAGKTIAVLLYLIALAQTDKQKTLTSVVSESIPHLKRGALRDFKNILQAHNYWKDSNWNATDSIYTFETGSQIEFFSTDNGDKLRGGRRDRCFMNEANNCTLDAFDQLEVRTKEFVILDYNPTNEFWALTDVKPTREDVDFVILTYKDNEALSPEIIQSIEARRERVQWWRVYGEGQLGEVEGRIYTGWVEIEQVPHEATLERYGLDFGYSTDPTAIVAVYKHNGGIILDEICYLKGLSNKRIAEILLAQGRHALVVADSAEPKSIDEIASYGVSIVPCQKGADSIRQGIQVVQEQRISYTKRSNNLKKEYSNFLWRRDKDGKTISPNVPEQGFDHLADSLRYAITDMFKNPVIDDGDEWDSEGLKDI
jgi:phage terminase large subunit